MTSRYCGRDFSTTEMELIENPIRDHPTAKQLPAPCAII